jgi:hypothetical protein
VLIIEALFMVVEPTGGNRNALRMPPIPSTGDRESRAHHFSTRALLEYEPSLCAMVLLTLEKASLTHPQCSLGPRTPTPRSLRSLGRRTGHRSLTTEWRVCVDPDVSEAARIAGGFLRLTLASGRESRPHSHWWYVTPKARPRSRGRRRHDAAGASLYGCRALVAPTVHIAGNRYI